VTIDKPPRLSTLTRPGLRGAAVGLGVLLGSAAAPALASPPDGWENSVNESLLTALLKLVGIPLLVMAVVALLVYLPGMVRGQSTDPALVFSQRAEWFGGPRTGVDAVDRPEGSGGGAATSTPSVETPASSKGGASARW